MSADRCPARRPGRLRTGPAGSRLRQRAGARYRAAGRGSARETEIVGWLREGKSNDEMAQILGISALTVKNHLRRIYRLLGVGNRAHVLARCLELRLLEA
ncbi:response regulator transcription factor [Massilia sp. LXY-6]|uniref:response regulator transcription factor n=1 Tax=Massilia sp. LXY-6 TaxID=3379823 RepID=UPI003EE056A4